MKVVFTYPLDLGSYPHMYEYCTILRAQGIDCSYIGVDEGVYVQDDGKDRVPVTYINGSPGELSIIRQIARIIDRMEPDIVHNFFYRGCGLLPLMTKTRRPRWVVDVRTIRAGAGFGQQWMIGLKNAWMWLETQSYDHILVLTEFLKKKFRYSLKNVTQIPLGANKARLNPPDRETIRKEMRSAFHIPESAPVFIYAGAVNPLRKVEHLIDAFAIVRKHYSGIYFFIAGGSDNPEFMDNIKERVKQHRMEKFVFITGKLPYFHMHRYYAASDIGLSYVPLKSPLKVQPPTKVVEYLMAGLICVSNKTESTMAYIDDGVNGFLCSEGVEHFVSGMQRALAAMENPGELIRNAANSVDHLEWSRIVADRLIPLYHRILNGPG